MTISSVDEEKRNHRCNSLQLFLRKLIELRISKNMEDERRRTQNIML